MNPISQILWEAAADVERRGVLHTPGDHETCAYVATGLDPEYEDYADQMLAFHVGIWNPGFIPQWNDAQPSRAVVAAEMRGAAVLTEWAGPHLLGGSK